MALTLMAPATAAAQAPPSDPVFDAPGFVEHRAYDELAPFESIDTLTGNLMLTFDDLVLPGDGGYDIKIQRIYNAKPRGTGFTTREWEFSIAGVPMRVLPIPDTPPIGEPAPQSHWPIVRTGDGADHLGIPVSRSSTEKVFRTKEFWLYRTTDRTLRLPNDLTCIYGEDGFLSEIRYEHGLLATVTWTDHTDPELETITQHVGGTTRTISFVNNGMSSKTMTYGQRTWVYSYQGFHLVSVQPPVGPTWQFTYHNVGQIGLQPLASVTTPQEGRIDYQWNTVAFRNAAGQTVPSYGLVQRRVSGNVPSGTWAYEYAWDSVGQYQVTTVRAPLGVTYRYRYRYLSNGFPVLTETSTVSSSTVDRLEEMSHQIGPVVDWRGGDQVVKSLHRITQGSRAYTTEYLYSGGTYLNYGQPSGIEERGQFTRIITRSYSNNFRSLLFVFERPYRPFLVTSESIAEPFASPFIRSMTYSPAAFKTSETAYGIVRTFTPDSRGNVLTERDGLGKETRYSYAWGAVQNTTTPKYTIERTINPDSTVASEKRNGNSTSYEYDGLFRRTRVTPPEGLATTTTFDGGNTVIIRRGTIEARSTLDGFGRVVVKVDGSGVRTESTFDVYGRQTYESLPFVPGPGSAGRGTTWSYDTLDRLIEERGPDGLSRTLAYGSIGDVQLRDEEGRLTIQQWSAAGTPEGRRLDSVTSADGATFSYQYNALGHLTRVVQPGGSERSWTYVTGTERVESESQPESGTVTYLYDQAARLSRRTDAAGQVFNYTYDTNDRLIGVDAPNTRHDQRFEYDDADNRTLEANGVVSSAFAYDKANRRIRRDDTFVDLSGAAVSTRYTYTDFDSIATITYPSSLIVSYTYDTLGRLREVRTPTQILATIRARHPSGAASSMTVGNVLETRTFDTRYRPDVITAGSLRFDYDYGSAGNVARVEDNRAGTQTFGYDAVNRLTSYTRGVLNVAYGYDPLGNRTRNGGATYTYDPSTLRATHLSYDALGRVTRDEQATYAYTPFGMLRTATVNGVTTRYRYDAANLRKVTLLQSGVTEYVVHGEGTQVLTEGIDFGGTFLWRREYVYAEGRLIASLRRPPSGVLASLAVSAVVVNVGEGGTANIGVQVTSTDGLPTRQPIAIPWRIQLFNEATGPDFQSPLSGTIVVPENTDFSSGPYRVDIPVVTTQDTLVEGPERFAFFLDAAPGVGLIAPSNGSVTIVDDDQAKIYVQLLAPEYSIGETGAEVGIGFRLRTEDNRPTTRAFTVNYRTTAGTAQPAQDYQHVQGSQAFAVGTAPFDFPVRIPIVNDAVYDPNESFTFSIDADAGIIVERASTTVRIVDDEPPPGVQPIVGFTAAVQQVNENAGSVTVALQVNTQGPPVTSAPITVNVATQNGTAVAGADYGSVQGLVTIPAGTANGAIIGAPISVVNDNVVEANEQFSVAIVGGSGAQPGILSQTITIVDDDAITVAFSPASHQVQETAGGVPVTVLVTTPTGQPTSRPATINYATVQDTAKDGLDFTGAAGTLVIAAGTPSGTPISTTLPVFDDLMDEANERFGLVLSSPNGSATVGPVFIVDIIDNDAPGANIEIDLVDVQRGVSESAGSVPVSVRVITANGSPTSVAVPLNFATAQGTATANVDYGHVSGGATIAVGTASGTLVSTTLPIHHDTIDEPLETFTLNISTALPAVSKVSVETIGIFDDDPGPFGLTASSSEFSAEARDPSEETPGDAKRARPPGSWTVEVPPPVQKVPLTWSARSTTDESPKDAPKPKGAQ